MLKSVVEAGLQPRRSLGPLRLIALVGSIGVVGLGVGAQEPPATLIIRNGPIYTADAAHPTAEAVAVRGERIVRVGTDADVMRLKGTADRGPRSSGCHARARAAGCARACPRPGRQPHDPRSSRHADVGADRRARGRAREDGPRRASGFSGFGWDQNDWPEKAWPTRAISRSRRAESSGAARAHRRPRLVGEQPGARRRPASMRRRRIRRAAGCFATPRTSPTGVLVDTAQALVERHVAEPGAARARSADPGGRPGDVERRPDDGARCRRLERHDRHLSAAGRRAAASTRAST